MGGFCSGPTPSQQQDIDTGKFSGSQAPKNSALDDIQMDLGMKPKNQTYFRDLEDRQKRSQEAMQNLGKDIFGRPASDDSPAPAPTPTPEIPPVAEAPEVPKPPKAPTGPAKITTAPKPEEKKPADKPGPSEGAAAPLKPDTGAGTTSAKAGQEEAAAIEATSEGEAETKVADTARKGRRKTIATSAKGLLSAPPVRKRRSLMGGLLS